MNYKVYYSLSVDSLTVTQSVRARFFCFVAKVTNFVISLTQSYPVFFGMTCQLTVLCVERCSDCDLWFAEIDNLKDVVCKRVISIKILFQYQSIFFCLFTFLLLINIAFRGASNRLTSYIIFIVKSFAVFFLFYCRTAWYLHQSICVFLKLD